MVKKFIKGSVFSLVALISLTSCTVLDNVIGSLLANIAINLPVLVTGVDLLPNGLEGDPEIIEWNALPTNKARPENFNYIKNILVIPNLLTADVYGIKVDVKITAEFSGAPNMIDNFKKISVDSDNLPEGLDLDLSSIPFDFKLGADVYIPVGNSKILEDLNGFEDLEDFMETTKQEDILSATNQNDMPFSVKIGVKSGRTSKSKTFYFRLTKPEFGEIVLDEAFKLGMLVNLFQFRFDEDPLIEFKQNEANDSANPLILSFLTDSLIIPKRVTIKDIGPIDVSYKFKRGNLANFFVATESRNPSEFTDDQEVLDMIEGEISAYTFTPVGTEYKNKLTGKNIKTVDDFADHIEAVTSNHNQSDLEDLYRASQSDPFEFELELTVSSGEESRSESYYFGMKKAMLDAQILDFVIENEQIVQKVHYSDTNHPIEVSSDTLDLEMLTETIAFPKEIKLEGFDPRPIKFSVDFEKQIDKNLFYAGTQELSAETTGFEGAELLVQTFTPIGEYHPKPQDNTLEKFANTIQGMFDNDVETLYDIVSFKHEAPIKLRLSASLEKDGVVTKSRIRTITINLKPADVDKEIIDYLIDDRRLINIVNYEDVQEIQGPNAENYIRNVGDSHGIIEVEHLADTIIIPSKIKLGNFEGKELKVDSVIGPNAPTTFKSTQEVIIDNFDITAKTITSTGGYVPHTTILNDFADELIALDTKDLYSYSQAAEKQTTIKITISLENDGKVTQKDKTFTIKFVKAEIDKKKIGDAIFATADPYSVVNVLNASDYLVNPNTGYLAPVNSSFLTTITLFYDTIVMPKQIVFTDFDGKTVNFTYSLESGYVSNIEDYFLPSEKEHLIDGEIQTVQTLTPKAGFNAAEAGISNFETLIGAINGIASNPFSPTSQKLFSANNNAVTINFTLTVYIEIDGVSAGSRTYLFSVSPASF